MKTKYAVQKCGNLFWIGGYGNDALWSANLKEAKLFEDQMDVGLLPGERLVTVYEYNGKRTLTKPTRYFVVKKDDQYWITGMSSNAQYTTILEKATIRPERIPYFTADGERLVELVEVEVKD